MKGKYYNRFRIFGWNIYISRLPLRIKPNRSRLRTSSKVERLNATDYHCELCGCHININCTLWHMLPKGAPRRNEFENVRVICPRCHKFVQTLGTFRPMIVQEGGKA
ncbi:MAG: hypothetical protein K2H38_12125 [Muribaculaceae bacterium]|nr:hypothetical protein [Muribaculaceae bacterium]